MINRIQTSSLFKTDQTYWVNRKKESDEHSGNTKQQHQKRKTTRSARTPSSMLEIPRAVREKYIDPKLFENDHRLLEILLEKIAVTPIGQELEAYATYLHRRNVILFSPSLDDSLGIFQHGESDADIQIILLKNNTPNLMAATLVHELSHFADFAQRALNRGAEYSLFDTEVRAFANKYRFIKEYGIHTDEYKNLHPMTKKLLEQTYRYVYGENLPFQQRHQLRLTCSELLNQFSPCYSFEMQGLMIEVDAKLKNLELFSGAQSTIGHQRISTGEWMQLMSKKRLVK